MAEYRRRYKYTEEQQLEAMRMIRRAKSDPSIVFESWWREAECEYNYRKEMELDRVPAGFEESWSRNRRRTERRKDLRIIDMTAVDLVAFSHRTDVAESLNRYERLLATEKMMRENLDEPEIARRLGIGYWGAGLHICANVKRGDCDKIRARIASGEMDVSGGLTIGAVA